MAKKLALDIVTLERKVWEDEGLDLVLLPGSEGDLGILPQHTPLLTALRPGTILIRKGGEDEFFAVGGGFADVRPDRVTVLAESAEAATEIDLERAEEARQRAAELLAEGRPQDKVSIAMARSALMRAESRIKVARRRRGRGSPRMRQ